MFCALAFLSSTASVNQNFADAKKERADAKKERADAKKETALRFELQDLHRRRDRLEDARRFDSLERMIKKQEEVQGMKPRVKEQPVDIDANTKKVVDIDAEIDSKIEEIDSEIKEKELKLKRINGYKGEAEADVDHAFNYSQE
jgi:hypothetical protein